MEDLKNYDDKLIYIIIFNIALSLLINDPLTLIKNSTLINATLLVLVLYLPLYIINNILPYEWKFKILYPENESHRFAYGIFTKLKNNNIHYDHDLIDVDLILNNYSMPETKIKEDKLWYEMYNKHRYDHKIYQQNRQFLFCRDSMASISIISIFILIFELIIGFKFISVTFLILIIEFIIFRNLAKKKNKTLVLYVLQEETNYLRKRLQIKELTTFNYNT